MDEQTASQEQQPASSPQQAADRARTAGAVAASGRAGETEPFVPADEAERLRARWEDIQVGFVDDPRRAVEDANGLVDEVTRRVVDTFTRARADLEEQWSRGDDVTTEELRLVLQRYRAFFDALLSTSKTT
jgi:predicted lipid-binding transport protein (Tim44 family)